ncbi:nucleotidyl transferase AbiEii/AbiGii toxin family protein [Streptomyces sp. NPDC006668]|uniref:nucleotidyl transferase AbiEii/AbiGii toxin family protein n=1 Tax=Streptomyces sp. NPDC006668 TaxID=3156903 RepID=UPI0033DB9C89
MDPFHARLARIGLGAAAGYGFVLAGGYAVQAHGFLERLSDDVDLFTDIADPVAFSEAVEAVAAAYRAADLIVEVEKSAGVFARFAVADEQGHTAKVELGCDWRARPPAVLEIGPVLHPDDAVANKVTTLFGRAAPRDYLDVNAALASGRYSGGRLLELASEHDTGFDPRYFAQALRAVDRWPDREYEAYGVDGGQVEDMRRRLRAWAAEILDERLDER